MRPDHLEHSNSFKQKLNTCLLTVCYLYFQTLLPTAAATSAGEIAVKKTAPTRITLSQYIKLHPTEMMLVGDGTNTSHCTLILKDKETGTVSQTDLTTACASRKSLKPPAPLAVATEQKLHYDVVPSDQKVLAAVQAGRQLFEQGAFANVPIPASRKQSTITQLAIWKTLAGKKPEAKDAVTATTVKSDLLRKANIEPSSLTAQENQKLDDRVNALMDAVDLTCKQVPQTSEQPKESKKRDMPETPGTSKKPDTPAIPSTSDPRIPVRVPTKDPQKPGEEEVYVTSNDTFEPDDAAYQSMIVLPYNINCGVVPTDGVAPANQPNDTPAAAFTSPPLFVETREYLTFDGGLFWFSKYPYWQSEKIEDVQDKEGYGHLDAAITWIFGQFGFADNSVPPPMISSFDPEPPSGPDPNIPLVEDDLGGHVEEWM